MSWRNRPPQREDFDTQEEYDEANDAYYEALESDFEERLERIKI